MRLVHKVRIALPRLLSGLLSASHTVENIKHVHLLLCRRYDLNQEKHRILISHMNMLNGGFQVFKCFVLLEKCSRVRSPCWRGNERVMLVMLNTAHASQ